MADCHAVSISVSGHYWVLLPKVKYGRWQLMADSMLK